MSQKIDIFQRLFARGIIRKDEIGGGWQLGFRAQRLSLALKASINADKVRERLRQFIHSSLDNSTTVPVPFYTHFKI